RRMLLTRHILLVWCAVLLEQAATLATVSYYRQKFLEDVAIGYIATTIRTLRAAVSEIPADDRAEFVRNASQNQWRLWSRTLPAEARLQRFSRTPPSPGTQQGGSGTPHRDIDRIRHRSHHDAPTDDIRDDLRSLIRKLNDRLNDGTRVALSHGRDHEIFISLTRNTDTEVAPRLLERPEITLERLIPPVTDPKIAAWLGGMGLVLLLAGGFSWHITRPLTRLAEAADRLAAGQPQRVQPSGPSETRALGERFNAMLDALAESESVRRTLLSGLPHDL